MILQQLVNGVTLGGIYALIALGYTLVYGILLMINFAHSEIVMLGAFAGWALLLWRPGAPVALVAVVAFAAVGLLGVLMERIAYRPLRRAPRLAPLISAIGVSLFLQNLVLLWSPSSQPFPDIFPVRVWRGGGAEITLLQVVILLVSIGLMVGLQMFVNRTGVGRSMRAVAQDHEVAGLMGINVNGIIALTFFIGAGLGGVAGILYGPSYHSIKYNMGFLPGIKAFTAAVLGGIGNVPGAMLGGFLLGILEAMGAGLIPGGSEWKDVLAFGILILVLIVRPSGLLGERVTEKV